MKQVSIPIYEFNELSEVAKEYARDQHRKSINYDYIITESTDTIDAFCKVFPVSYNSIDYDRKYADYDIDDDSMMSLRGPRLMAYIINNYWHGLYSRRFYKSIGDNKELHHPCIEIHWYGKGARVRSSNFYHSRIQWKPRNCALTGVCYDESILGPIYDFLEKPNYTDSFGALIQRCFNSLINDVNSELDEIHSDEYIDGQLSELEFTQDGKEFIP